MALSTQLTIPVTDPDAKDPFDSRVEGAFGEFVGNVPAEARLQFIREITNKVSWVLGSAYQKRYSGKNTEVQKYAARVVKAILRDHGYKI